MSEKHPVGNDNKRFHPTVEQHFQVALEAASLVMHIGQNWKIGRLVESVFDTAKDHRTERIGHVEDHDADRVTALAAQRTRKLVRAISELLRRPLDAFFVTAGM